MSVKQHLERPFPVNRLHFRIGATNSDKTSGIALAYIDARDVMKRLDDAVGFENWQCRYSHTGNVIVCEIGIQVVRLYDTNGAPAGATKADGVGIAEEWMWRANGAGETAVEGEKGGCSDAFKRAAVMWGIGRYLYALPNVWVPTEPVKRGDKLFAKLPESSIKQLYDRLPAWATPEGYDKLIEERKSA